ncbi:MAG TPA: hypothetical protein VFY80_06550, partial [Burkholderiales bacterium]|nr:hypothetical protein [Burkholderiales bacterium]
MIGRSRPFRFLIGAAFALACLSAAAGEEDDFLAAREAFRMGDAAKLERHAERLRGYVLEPYVTYWRLRMRLEQADPGELRMFIERYAD